MRILFVHTRYLHSAGGEDAVLNAEVNLMKAKGHDVLILLFDNGEMKPGISGKIKAAISSVYNRSSAKKIAETIRNFKPDIIHVHNFFFTASPSVLIEASRLGIAIVVTIHNFRLVCTNALLLRNNNICELCLSHDFPWYGMIYKCYHNSAIQSAMVGGMSAIHKWMGTWKNKVDIYFTPSSFSREKLIGSSFNVSPEKIIVKHNFINDPGTEPPEKRQSFYLFVGRLSAEKGLPVLLEAWAKIENEQLIVAGDGPEKDILIKLYGHLPNVTFAGKKERAEVIRLMKQCKALIFPSVCYEGSPITIIEALATGTPVIASSLGGMKEMITDGKNGLLFEAGESDELLKAIHRFNGYVSRRDFRLYTNARLSYMELYHPDKCYESAIKIYRELADQKKSEKQVSKHG